MAGSFLMFHWVRGVPFEFNAGAYDNLNMWEQIDSGDQYTPAKKFLLSVPIILFLVSTHYTHYDITYFMINFMATLAVVVPKLPAVSLLADNFENPLLTNLTASSYAHRSFQSRRRGPMIYILRTILFLSQVDAKLGPAFLDQRYQIILLHPPEESNEQITGSQVLYSGRYAAVDTCCPQSWSLASPYTQASHAKSYANHLSSLLCCAVDHMVTAPYT